jgi:hypothetical protein
MHSIFSDVTFDQTTTTKMPVLEYIHCTCLICYHLTFQVPETKKSPLKDLILIHFKTFRTICWHCWTFLLMNLTTRIAFLYIVLMYPPFYYKETTVTRCEWGIS